MATGGLSKEAREVLQLLCQKAEGLSDEDNFRDIYLDNAKPADMSSWVFEGYLAGLEAAGYFRRRGKFWGRVRDDAFQVVA